MMSDKVLVAGAGGHAKVVIDAMRSAALPGELVVADDDGRKLGQVLLGHRVITPLNSALEGVGAFHVAIGDNAVRARVTEYLAGLGLRLVSVVHPRACIAASASIGDGAFVAANAVLGPDANLGAGCIVNHGAVVDHDCQVAAFSHIAPGATLAGGVRIGSRVLIGAGANILPGVTIGDDCVVGAGAVVLHDLAPGSVHVGVPARKFR
ncbi:acetyltransferase [Janthinobacterium sp. 17J80-10]|uniref:acetyltransferase n=1 Tax=Janthinobacterium sp. 17J80-10 TaxID=2497863 RepID=UPI0010054C54|nr:acetyltransferase [Janthinobacterium sp. 17J80-10]QAU33073.1 acetyltransferase [Janthinobacterium sp. 17J80-10]